MAVEIERKFLVRGDGWRNQGTGILYRQGYLSSEAGVTVRVRIAGAQGYLTIKSLPNGLSRAEFEYPIPLEDAQTMLDTLCPHPLIEKIRYRFPCLGVIWEVDEFLGDNNGLILAEVELSDPDQVIPIPNWVGQEVSDDRRYANANLAKVPYSQWCSG